MQRKIRVLVAKPGLDGHDRGAKVVAAALRDAGMEVIYTGLHQSSEQVVEAAVQEDVDVVALSILSGAHMTLFPEVLALMRERGVADRLLTGGGIIPPEDMERLGKMGVGRLFGPGSSTQDIAAYIRGWFSDKFGADALPPLPPPPARPAVPVTRAEAAKVKAAAKPKPKATKARPRPKAKPGASRAKRALPKKKARAAVKKARRASGRSARKTARPKRARRPARKR